jgi:Tfp pilus assembly protein PilO
MGKLSFHQAVQIVVVTLVVVVVVLVGWLVGCRSTNEKLDNL